MIKFFVSCEGKSHCILVTAEYKGATNMIIYVQVTSIEDFQCKKKWETSNVPYLFFNEDGDTFTTLGLMGHKSEFICLKFLLFSLYVTFLST